MGNVWCRWIFFKLDAWGFKEGRFFFFYSKGRDVCLRGDLIFTPRKETKCFIKEIIVQQIAEHLSTQMWVFLKTHFFPAWGYQKFPMQRQKNLIHIESHMRAVRWCYMHTRAKRSSTTSKHKSTLANQKPEKKKRKSHFTGNGSATPTAMARLKGSSHVWTDDEAELLLNVAPEKFVKRKKMTHLVRSSVVAE